MKITKYIIAFLFALTLFAGTVAFFLIPKKDFSENENRMLAKFPDFEFKSLENGDFTKGLENYFKDHFPCRDGFMKIKTSFQLASGYKKIEDVHIGKNRLFQDVQVPDPAIFINSSNTLFSSLDNKDITTSVILLPSAMEIYKDELPPFTSTFDQNETIDSILSSINCDVRINPTELLNEKSKNENVFYTTDHHWTTTAAFYTYEALMQEISEAAVYPLSDYEKDVISSSFRGSLHNTVLDDSRYDEVCTLSHPDVSFTASYLKSLPFDVSEPFELISYQYFSKEALDKKDAYSYFGGGNFALVVLENTGAKTDNEVLVVKDSFANCFVPFLAENYKRIHIIDPRNWVGGISVSEYVNKDENKNISDVLILYGINSLNSGVTSFS